MKFTFTVHWQWDSERWGAMDVSAEGETREIAQKAAEEIAKTRASKQVARNCSTRWRPQFAALITIREVTAVRSKAAA